MSDSVLGNKFNLISDDGKKIILTPSLLMRLFEWCHEDAANDIAMHKVFEKIIAFTDGTNPLNMDVYDALVSNANDGQEKDSEEENECQDSNTAEYYDTYCAEPYDMKYCCHGYDTPYAQADYAQYDNCCHTYDSAPYAGADCSYPDPNTCCHAYTVDYNDVECISPSCFQNITPSPASITITCTDEDCSIPCEQPEQCEYDKQIDDIIKLGQF